MISSNGVDSNRPVRIPKFEFTQIQKNIETTLLKEYPTLSEKIVYKKLLKKNKKEAHKEQQLKRRTGNPSKKDQLRKELLKVFYLPYSQTKAISILKAQGINLTQRGKNYMATKDKLKCRLSTLGVDEQFARIQLPREERDRLNHIDSLKIIFEQRDLRKNYKI